MQKDKTGDIFKRTNYYISRIMSKSLKRGESYNKLPKALAIWIIDYKEKEIKKYKSDLKLCDTKEAMELYRLEQDIEIEKISREEYIKDTAKEEGITLAKRSAVKNFYKNNVSKDIICQSLEKAKEELENILKEC